MDGTAFDILLVEDSPSDQLLAKRALAEDSLKCRVHVVPDGVEAMAFLRREGKYGSTPRPSLILLDLNMPRKSGREVLAEVKTSEALKRIPIVVLTTSQSPHDLDSAYGLHANCYVVKPIDFAAFKQAMRTIKEFWFKTVCLPNEGTPEG